MDRRWSIALLFDIPLARQDQIIPDAIPRRLSRAFGVGHVACFQHSVANRINSDLRSIRRLLWAEANATRLPRERCPFPARNHCSSHHFVLQLSLDRQSLLYDLLSKTLHEYQGAQDLVVVCSKHYGSRLGCLCCRY